MIINELMMVLSRRQPEHFLKVCCQRMGVIFGAHLLLADLYYSLYTFHCHCFVWNLETLAWECDRAAGDCQSLQVGPNMSHLL